MYCNSVLLIPMDIFRASSGALVLEEVIFFASEHVAVVLCIGVAVLIGLLCYGVCMRRGKGPREQGIYTGRNWASYYTSYLAH